MISIANYISTNYTLFGLSSANELKLVSKPKGKLVNGGRWLTVLPLRTSPDSTHRVPFNNLMLPGVRGERFMTQVEIECKTRAMNPGQDFYWNEARKLRDKVYNALAGKSRGGIVMPRYDWTDIENPIVAGEIWFKVDPGQGTPLEDPVDDPDDSANKSIFLTYNVHWWKPV